MSRKLTGLPAAIDRRSLLLWGVPLLGVNRSAPVWLLGSRTTGQNTPSAHSDKLEHIFELASSSWQTWIKALDSRIPRLMQETSVPGLSIVLIRDAKIYWHGIRRSRRGDPSFPVD